MCSLYLIILSGLIFSSVSAVETSANKSYAIEPGLDYSIAKGGRLYDKWFKEKMIASPKQAHPSYPDSGKYKGKKSADWRCKECHGWDYQGKNGLYRSGKHYSGIDGISQVKKISLKKLTASMRNKPHQYNDKMLSDSDVNHLLNFIQHGLVEMSHYIDVNTNKAKGNASKGKNYYQTLCASCHGLDAKIEDMPDLPKLSKKNPWEVMHKIQNGQPGEDMPALKALDISITVDILTYLQFISVTK